ncbi:glycosyl hydrolase family 28-related protein [Frondihabitans sp. PhB188]|uniref:glycosyl hydrolase family 28-related protein n=1 Tax=Frondihabitans sp. PhB188 TaxID=2485200 RepID=UPI00131535EC|nr:glycosyl hydrolase family 28-related protein [Frondihabitans sp. PhB188]
MPSPTPSDSRRGFLAAGGLAAAGAVVGSLSSAGPAVAAADPETSPRVSVDVTEHGAKPDGKTDCTKAFAAAIAAAAVVRGRVVVPAGDYLIESVTVPSLVKIQGLGADVSRYGASTSGGVNLKHRAASTQPMMIVNGNGITLENLGLQGNGSAAPLIRVDNGFESRFERLQLSGVAGTALQVERVNNNLWTDVFVNNSGSASAAAVVFKSPKTGTNSNTITCVNLTIEGSPGPALDLGYGTSSDYFVEFVRLIALHVEALQKGVDPAGVVRIGNVRQVELVAPIIYGGPGPLVVHDQRAARSIELWGGIRVIGGALLGVDPAQASGPSPVLVKLTRGDDFSLAGTRLGRFTKAGVELGATYGSRFLVDPTCRIQNWGGSVPLLDHRATGSGFAWAWPAGLSVGGDASFAGRTTISGHLSTPATPEVSPTAAALAGLGKPTTAPTVAGTDTAGRISVTAGASPAKAGQVRVTFAEPFERRPTVMVTPATSSGGPRGVYVQASKSFFDVCLSSALQARGSADFNYVVIG